MFKSCVIIRKPRSTLYSYWLSVNLPNLMLSVLSLIDAKPNTLVDYVKRTGAALARNKGSDGKVSTRQLTSWRLTDVTLTNVTLLMWLCWLRILINHGEGLVLTNERVAEACVIEPQWGLQENLPWILRGRRRSRANMIFRYMYLIQYCFVQCWDWSLPISYKVIASVISIQMWTFWRKMICRWILNGIRNGQAI